MENVKPAVSANDKLDQEAPPCDDDLDDAPRHQAPDGGWGWVVCFACFMTHVLIDGVTYSFGIIFAEFLDYYKGSKAETAWIISLSTSVCYISGPFVAALMSQFGCRAVAAAGTLITSLSLIISIYTPSLHFLYFSFGILYGLGYGMTYLPTIVCVSEYFDKRRALATGLGVCGSGIGTFIFSPLTAVLIEAYAWRGALLIQAGLILNCLAASLVYRPLPERPKKHSLLDHDTPGDDLNTHNQPRYKQNDAHDNGVKDLSKKYELQDVELHQDSVVKRSIEKQYSSDIPDVTFEIAAPRKQVSLCSMDRPLVRAFADSVRESCNVEPMKSKAMVLFVVSYFFYSLGYFIPYVYLPVKSRDVGVDEISAAWILATIGIANTVGRVVFGYLSDKKWMNRLYLYNTALVICGLGTSLGPLLNSLPSLIIYAAVFGLFSGVTISLTSVLLADFVGIKNLSSAFGVANFVAGIAILIGPPVGGWLYDVSGSYNGAFLAAGVTIAFSGAILYAIPCVDRNWNKR